jgi:hypothetical protein
MDFWTHGANAKWLMREMKRGITGFTSGNRLTPLFPGRNDLISSC